MPGPGSRPPARPQRVPRMTNVRAASRRGATDDLDHHDQQEQPRDRLRDRVDDEQASGRSSSPRPASPAAATSAGSGSCRRGPRPPSARDRTADVELAEAPGPERACRAGEVSCSLPADRKGAARAGRPLDAWIIQRASSVKTTVIAARISASTSGDGVPVMYGWPANTSWRIASSPTANGSVAIARAPSAPSRPTGKLSPDEVHGLDQEVGHVKRLAAPEQEQAGEHHPQPVQRRERQANTTITAAIGRPGT